MSAFDFIEFIQHLEKATIAELEASVNEIAIVYEILRFSGHSNIFKLWKCMYSKLDVFNFMMLNGYSVNEINAFEMKYNLKLSSDIRLSLLICKPISFPLIFCSYSISRYMTRFNPHSKEEFIQCDPQKSHYDVYQLFKHGYNQRKRYCLSPECLISPLNEWKYLTKHQITQFFLSENQYDPEEYARKTRKPGTYCRYYIDPNQYDINVVSNSELTTYLRCCSAFKDIKMKNDLNDRFILIGDNQINEVEIDITDNHQICVEMEQVTYLVYDKYSENILVVYYPDGSHSVDFVEYFFYPTFWEYFECHIFVEIDYTLYGMIKNVTVPSEKMMINYIKDYLSPDTKDCILLSFDFIDIKLKDNDDNTLDDVDWNDIHCDLHQIVCDKEIIIQKKDAMNALRKYFRNQHIFKQFGSNFLDVLAKKMKYIFVS